MGNMTDTATVPIQLHAGQMRGWNSEALITAIIAGSQSGKTYFGPRWMLREISRRGPGDYLVGTATFPLLSMKVLPECERYWGTELHLGVLREDHGLTVFQMPSLFPTANEPTRVIFFSAKNPESIESATAKAAWLDEAGQYQFHPSTWDAVQRRLRIHAGRVLITTTPYNLGWLKTEIYDPWKAGQTDIDVVNFESIENPAFPIGEWNRAMATMPKWKFDMFHRGLFSRPSGIIYDCFDPDHDIIEDYVLPKEWSRYTGHDFGGTNMAALWYASDPASGDLIVYREYTAGGLTAAGHVTEFRRLSPGENILKSVGGALSEDQWRAEFGAAGWYIEEPAFKDVEVGIQRVYGWHRSRHLKVFASCKRYIAEKTSYSRELGADYQPTMAIEAKEHYHLMDCERYLLSGFAEPATRDTLELAMAGTGRQQNYRECDEG